MLADASGWGGGAWGRDGVIVFSAEGARTLLRVVASGGTAVPVTPLTPGDQVDCWPQFLPDGRRFLFFHQTNSADSTGVYLGSLDGGEPTRILSVATMAVYAPPGVLLHVRQGVLVSLQFDPIRGVVTGEPTPVAHNIGDGGFPPFRAPVSVSTTGVLVYRVAGGERLRQLVWIDRAGVDEGTVGPPFSGFFIGAVLSPDGQRVAVGRTVSGNLDVWLSDVGSGTQSRFTFDRNDDGYPIWSPDGSRVVFASTRNGAGDLFQKLASGSSDEQPLVVTPEEKAPLSWSRDGRFLLYRARRPGKVDFDLWALPMSGERKPFPVLQSSFDEGSGEIAPDGKWVAYTSNESGRMEVYVQSFPGPGGKRQLSSMGGTQLRWRPDGHELFYIAPDERLMAVPIAVGADGQMTAGAPMPLFLTRITPYYDRYAQYSIAPDGRFLMNVVVEAPVVPPITVVLNWDAALKQ